MKRKHITEEQREAIEKGIRNEDSARKIARTIGTPASTVTREVKANRTIKPTNTARARLPKFKCRNYSDCERVAAACEGCTTGFVRCRDCRTHPCTDTCPDFVQSMCPTTLTWPYVCPDGCKKRKGCTFPKCSYDAHEAHDAYRERLSSSRSGVDITDEELAELDARVTPLVRKGHSFAAICAEEEIPVCERTLYNYQELGLLSSSNLDLPEKARKRPRKKAKKKDEEKRERVDRTGRRYDDFKALPIEDQARVVQGDSVCGGEHDRHDILTLMPVARKFQLYLLKGHGVASETVECLDTIERAMGSPEAFEAALGVLLVDRGTEFDDWEGMERSCLVEGERRCRVFYCDPQESNQKSPAERNHEQLRRILPKGRTDMDKLTADDVALCCSHVNSYPLASLGGRTTLDSLGGLLPDEVLALVGVERLDPKDVVLKPSLVPHAVAQ